MRGEKKGPPAFHNGFPRATGGERHRRKRETRWRHPNAPPRRSFGAAGKGGQREQARRYNTGLPEKLQRPQPGARTYGPPRRFQKRRARNSAPCVELWPGAGPAGRGRPGRRPAFSEGSSKPARNGRAGSAAPCRSSRGTPRERAGGLIGQVPDTRALPRARALAVEDPVAPGTRDRAGRKTAGGTANPVADQILTGRARHAPPVPGETWLQRPPSRAVVAVAPRPRLGRRIIRAAEPVARPIQIRADYGDDRVRRRRQARALAGPFCN